MTTTTDPIDLLTRALDQTGALVAGIRPEQTTLPTPCRSWDVRALVQHLVTEVHRFAAVTGGHEHRGGAADGDLSRAYRAAADTLLAAWRQPGALDRPHPAPWGEVSAAFSLDQQVTELAMHAWDLAKATGSSTDLDAEIGQRALGWGRENLRPEFRGDEADGFHVGPEVPVPDDAPLYDRLAAFGGRDPAFAAVARA